MKALRFWIFGLVLFACGVGAPPIQDASTPIPPGWDDAGTPAAPPPKAEPATTEMVPARVAPPPVVDKRTPAQLALAACSGPGGHWLCPKVKQPQVLAASGATPIIPTSWTVPAWFVDPANSSGNASDGNACTTSGAPCLTWHEINDHRWGCVGNPYNCPRFQQGTTITFTSSHTDDTDPVYFRPAWELGANAPVIAGALGASQQIASGVLSNVTAKNRATPQLLLAQSGANAIGQYVVNSTHSSVAWTYALSSGSIYKMTQPEVPIVLPSNACTAEVDTWANGDSVTVYQPVSVNIVAISGVFDKFNGGFSNSAIILHNINIFDSGSFDAAELKNATLLESASARIVSEDATWQNGFGICNSYIVNMKGGSISQTLIISAGVLGPQTSDIVDVAIVGDIIIGGTVNITTSKRNGTSSSPVYVDTGKSLFVVGGGSFVGTGGIWWGPGTIGVAGMSRFLYTVPAATNLIVGALQLNGLTTGNSVFTAANVVTPCGGITVNKSNLDTAASATCATTGFGGLAFEYGGAAFAGGGGL